MTEILWEPKEENIKKTNMLALYKRVFVNKISQDKDLDKTIQAFRTVAGTCKGCHKKFRN